MIRKSVIELGASPLNNTIPMVVYRASATYSSTLVSAIQEAAQNIGYRVEVLDSQNSPALQLKQVEAVRDSGKKGIIIQLVDANAAPQILEAAGDMKVVFVNREPADMSILNENAIYVGSDETVAGKLQGEWLANHFNRLGMNNIKYLLLQGIPDLPNTIKRTEGALQALQDAGIRATAVAPPIVANYNREEAMMAVYNYLLTSGVNFDAIIANNDGMALGAIDALKYLSFDPSKIPIVGVDAVYQAFLALKDGELAMTVFQNAKAQGATVVTALMNMLTGRPINEGTGYPVSPENPYVIFVPFEPVTLDHIPKDLVYPVPVSRICRRGRRPL